LAAIVDQSTDFIGIAELNGRAIYVNEAGRHLVGLSGPAAVSETSVMDYFAPADRATLEREVLPAVTEQGYWEGELHFRNFATGAETPVLYNMFPVRDAAGQIIAYATVTRDLTERKRAEARLRETERRLNAVLDNATVSVLFMDDRQRCIYMNRAAEQLTGYTLEEVLARDCPLHDIVHHTYPDGRPFPLHECAIDRAFPENALTQGEEVFVHKDGHFYPVAFTASPIRDEASRTVGTIIEVRDISAEKVHEAALRESRDRLASERHALEVLNQTGSRIAAELDLDRLVQTIVDAGVELTGAQFGAFFYNVLDDAGGKYMLYALSGAERSAFENFGMPRATAVFAPTFRGDGIIRSADILVDERYGRNAPHSGMPKGHLPVRSYLAAPVVSRSGEVIGGLFFGHPEPGVFSERAEQVLAGLAAQAAIGIDNARLLASVRREQERFQAAVRAVRGIMWTNDAEGRMTGEQPGWTAITGQTREEYEGYGWARAVHPEDAQPTIDAWKAAVAERRTFLFEHRVRSRDGSWRRYAIRGEPIFNAAGEIREWIGVHTDITEQREAEAELRESNEEIQRYAYIVSHDLRAPLVNVMGFTSELEAVRDEVRAALQEHPRAQQIDVDMSEALGFIRAAITKMESLIAAILKLSREGRRTFRPEPLDMAAVVQGIADAQRHQAGAAGATVRVATKLPEIVADRLAVEQIFGNLIDNALKYLSPERPGRIEISADAVSGGRVRFHVRDNGRGIAPQDHARVFELFRRSGVQDRPGEGIGLAHVKALVRSLGGRIEVSSELGEGTTFTVTLPLHAVTVKVPSGLQPVIAAE
jgi:PAS domain S-box-containing protein